MPRFVRAQGQQWEGTGSGTVVQQDVDIGCRSNISTCSVEADGVDELGEGQGEAAYEIRRTSQRAASEAANSY